ncbi:SusC/RagA family TonB-linked outer membrane protein, partial [Alistipes putredinis]|nr:SusC/RagA family TonB-linked outer membrane protein [Alistipes putredinis]
PGNKGFDKIATNFGTLRKSGIEAEVRANIINKGGFTWDMTANLSTVANKIIKLPDNKEVNNRVGGAQVWDPNKGELVWVGGRQEGGKLGELIAYKQNHIFKDWDDVKKYANNRIDNVANLYGPGKA